MLFWILAFLRFSYYFFVVFVSRDKLEAQRRTLSCWRLAKFTQFIAKNTDNARNKVQTMDGRDTGIPNACFSVSLSSLVE